MKWAKTEIENAINLFLNGCLFEDIANKLNRTFRSVQVKLNSLGYKNSENNYYEKIICNNCDNEFKALISEKENFVHNHVQEHLMVKYILKEKRK